MAMFNQEKFNKFLISYDIVGFYEKPKELKSGRKSRWYANCRRSTDYVRVKDELVEYMFCFMKDKDIFANFFVGVPEGATKIGLFLTDKLARDFPYVDIELLSYLGELEYPLVMGRSKAKEHGDAADSCFIGPVRGIKGKKAVVVEDVTTTGGSLISSIKNLREAGAIVEDAIGIINRMELDNDGKSVEEKVNELDVNYHAMSDAFQLLPLARKKYNPSEEVIKAVEEYYKKYGVKEIKL